jgi:hypothetical protein
MNNPRERQKGPTLGWAALLLILVAPHAAAVEAPKEREPITISIVAVNPSAEKTQVVPVRIDLPQEVTPKDVLEQGELELQYDEERRLYYVYKETVELKPKETRVFEVTVRDLWFIPEPQLESLKGYTGILLQRLQRSEYYESAKQLGDSVLQRLAEIATVQTDESLGRKARIGAYRYHLQTLEKIKEDLARMEKLLTFTGGPPVPEMLEESPLKADAPSTTTTWLVIFLVIVFLGLLGGQFFFTWHRRGQATRDLNVVRQAAFHTSRHPNGSAPLR